MYIYIYIYILYIEIYIYISIYQMRSVYEFNVFSRIKDLLTNHWSMIISMQSAIFSGIVHLWVNILFSWHLNIYTN